VELTSEQLAMLPMWAGSGRSEQRMALRVRIILFAANGMTLREIAAETGLTFRICFKWRKHFLASDLKIFPSSWLSLRRRKLLPQISDGPKRPEQVKSHPQELTRPRNTGMLTPAKKRLRRQERRWVFH
jgi:hypothetical protein